MAHIAAFAFHDSGTPLIAQHIDHQWHILVGQLLLQVNRVGADHDPLAILNRPHHGRDQIRQTLAGASPSLDKGMRIFIERVNDFAQHIHLRLTRFVAREELGKWTIGCQCGRDFIDIERFNIFFGLERLSIQLGFASGLTGERTLAGFCFLLRAAQSSANAGGESATRLLLQRISPKLSQRPTAALSVQGNLFQYIA